MTPACLTVAATVGGRGTRTTAKVPGVDGFRTNIVLGTLAELLRNYGGTLNK